ncbi:MAG: TRAM domain-containing protein [Acidobacteria bacterium]|nr:TRAM domain-containing protein [Acidobacteriota bacterium]
MDTWIVRLIFAAVLTYAAVAVQPAGASLGPAPSGALGALTAAAIITFEIRIRRLSLKTLIGAVIGSILGIAGAALISLVLSRMESIPKPTLTFLQLSIMMFMAYVGLLVGADKGNLLNMKAFDGLFATDRTAGGCSKIIDTSVVIDGRIADLCETGFVEGTLIVPQFVLQELQLIADSPDSIRRTRGRRGLDILQRIQKMGNVTVQFTQTDYPEIREVDMKLLELARELSAKVMTNDLNLNKVAQLRGIGVLNINDLANALKPPVPPGEIMKVMILKEGKEENQGIAYLDDGTMVVVDEGRTLIGKSVEIVVTSLLQTTAGKMIFGRINRILGNAAQPGMREQRAAR